MSKSNGKSMGLITLLAMMLGSVIGTGVLITPSFMVQYGKWGYLAWPVSSMMCLGLAFMFGNMAGKMVAQGPAGFVHKIFGQFPGFQVSWAQWLGLIFSQGVIAYAFGQYMAPIIGDAYAIYISLCGIWLVTVLSMFMTVLSLTGVLVLTTIKVSLLILLIVSGLPHLNIAKVSTLPIMNGMSDLQAFAGALSFSLMAYIGIEFATIPGENVKNPKVTIPLATILGTVIAGVVYTLSYTVVGSAFTQEALQHSARPIYDAIVLFLGDWAGYILVGGYGLGFFASLNGLLFGQSYILKHAAETEAMPKVFTKTTKSAGFPHVAALLSSSLSTVVTLLIYTGYFSPGTIGGLSVALTSLVYLWSTLAFRYMSSNTLLWIVNLVTCFVFLAGSLLSGTNAGWITLIYLCSFFVYGLFHKNKYISTVV